MASVGGLTRLLLTLADDVLGDYLTGEFSSLHIVSVRFEGVGAFTARSTRVLPVSSTRTDHRLAATPYASSRHLAEAAVREEVQLAAGSPLAGTRLEALPSRGLRLSVVAIKSADGPLR